MRRAEICYDVEESQSQVVTNSKRVKKSLITAPIDFSPVSPAPSKPLTNGVKEYEMAIAKVMPPARLSYLFSEILPEQLVGQYEIIDEIARGASGRVYRARHRETGTLRAIKHIKKLINHYDMKEIEILKGLSHPNIVIPLEYCLDSENLFIVSDLCTGGSLFDKISREKHFSEVQCREIVRQVLLALHYLHSHNVVHRDIKPENLVFESDKPDALIKIIDFGLGAKVDSDYLNIVCGTALYVAPEVLKRKYTNKCDIWSLGAVLYKMLSGRNLVDGSTENEMLTNLSHLKEVDILSLCKVVSRECYLVIEQMLIVDQEQRSSAAKLLESDWLRNNNIQEPPNKEPEMAQVVKNLRNFTMSNYLANIIYFYTTSCIVHNEEKQKLSKIFLDLDVDCDGKLSYLDLVICFEKSGRSYARSAMLAKRIFSELNIDLKDGIEFKEFVSICYSKQTLKNEEALQRAFKAWDVDGSGEIDIDTIVRVLRSGCFAENPETAVIAEEIIKHEIGTRDKVTYETFKGIMNRFAENEQMSQSIK